MKIKSSERNRLSLLPARAPLLPPNLPPAPSPPCLLPLVSGPTQHRLCSVFPHPLHGPWVFGLKPPSLLAPLSSSLKYVQIFLILKKKKKETSLTSHPFLLLSLHSRFFQKLLYSPHRHFPHDPPKSISHPVTLVPLLSLSPCGLSSTSHIGLGLTWLPRSIWDPPDLLEPPPSYVLSASHSAGFLLLNPSFILAFFPGFLLLTPLSTTQRGDTIRAPSFHLFSSHWEYSCWVTLWLHLSPRCPRFQGQHL